MFEDAVIDRLADRLALAVSVRLEAPESGSGAEDRWFDSREAADYLAISRDALHKLTASRKVAFSQTVPGAPCFFRRSDLDAYRLQYMRETGA